MIAPRGDGRHRVLLGLEHPRRAGVLAALVPGELDHAPFGREVALAGSPSPPVALDRIVERADDAAGPRLPRASSACSPTVRPVTVCASAWSRPASFRRFITSGTPPAAYRSGATYWPPGLRSHSSGVCSLIRSKSSIDSSTPDLVGDREQVQHAVGRAAAAGDRGDRVLEALAGDDVARALAALEHVHHESPGVARRPSALRGSVAGHHREAGRRDARAPRTPSPSCSR